MITFESVTKRYPGGTVAVDGLDLEVPDGKTMVLVGPSGCGKTTTLRMINRLIDPTEGRILLDGQDISQTGASQLRRGIGYVIQQTGLFPHRTIEDNIATVPLLNGWPKAKARARARELMDLVGLDQDMGRRYPYQLSGGQQQRVGVARALAADPPVLLMDEPFSAVDPIVRATLQDELTRLQGELHKTVVLVTHDVEEAIKVGDVVAVWYPHGKIAQIDTPERLLGAPADDYVESFLGFDRGIRRLAFFPAAGLDLETETVLGEDVTVELARQAAKRAGASWVLVTSAEGQAAGLGRTGRARSRQRGRHPRPAHPGPLRPHLPGGPGLAARGPRRDRAVAQRTRRRRRRRRPRRRSHFLRTAADRDPRRGRGRRPRSRPGLMSWAWANRDQIAHILVSHLYLAFMPVLFGIVVSIPVGIMCVRYRWTWPPILSLTSIFYALPSLALYLVLIDYTGLTDWTVIIPLTLFSLSVLIPSVVDGLRSVPQPVRQAATAMGFGALRQTLRVELPLAIPIIIAGLRVATVSSISLVSVGQLIGIGGLGYFFTDGEQRDFTTEIYVALILIVILAFIADGLLVLARWWLTPWERGRSARDRRRVFSAAFHGSRAEGPIGVP